MAISMDRQKEAYGTSGLTPYAIGFFAIATIILDIMD